MVKKGGFKQMKFEGLPEIKEKEGSSVFFVTGGEGMVGRRFKERMGQQDVVIANGRHDFDLLMDREAIAHRIKGLQKEFGITMLINFGAITDVDFCETQKGNLEGTAWRTNALAPGYMAEACNILGITFVQVSTDYVYEDLGKGPHHESDPLKPIGFYAESKLQGEIIARRSTDRCHIVRIQRPFTDDPETTRGGIPRDAYNANRAGKTFNGITDQTITPTYVNDCVDAIVKISTSTNYGDWNVSSPTAVTPHAFVEMAFNELEKLGIEINWDLFGGIHFADIPWRAPRPRNTAFSIEKFESHFGKGILRPLGEQVKDWAFQLVKRRSESSINA